MTYQYYDLFRAFVSNLEDAGHFDRELENDIDEGLTLDQQENRLGWAWHRLSEFAQSMGPDFADVGVRCDCEDCDSVRRGGSMIDGRVH